MPANILAIAREGVTSIGWNKDGDVSNNPDPGTQDPGTQTPGDQNPNPGTPNNPNPIVTPPSNVFSAGSTRSSGTTGVITMNMTLPGPGSLQAVGTSTIPAKFTKVVTTAGGRKRAKKITYGRATVTASQGGAVKLTIKPSSAAKKALKKGAKLKVSVKLTFTPSGGTAATQTKTVIVKGKKPKRKS